MPELLLDLSHTEIPHQIQENLIAYMTLFAGLPNMVMENSDIFWFVSKKPAPGNIILRTNWAEANLEAQIDRTLQQIGQHVDGIGWFVFPGDQPPDLGKQLDAYGMEAGRGGNWMWADLTHLSAALNVPKDFHIERVMDDQMLAEWVCISEVGFGNNDLGCFYDAYVRHGYGEEAFSLHYTGYWGDIPVTSGTLLEAGGCATIYDLSTPPEFRGKGFGGALTAFQMQEIRKRGYQDTWIWSSDMARSLYRSLGYVDADFGLREHKWHK